MRKNHVDQLSSCLASYLNGILNTPLCLSRVHMMNTSQDEVTEIFDLHSRYISKLQRLSLSPHILQLDRIRTEKATGTSSNRPIHTLLGRLPYRRRRKESTTRCRQRESRQTSLSSRPHSSSTTRQKRTQTIHGTTSSPSLVDRSKIYPIHRSHHQRQFSQNHVPI